MSLDHSHGWDEVAPEFLRLRSAIGAEIVRAWCRRLVPGAAVLDLGCGSGFPVTAELLAAGCQVLGIDASERMLASFRERFPRVPVRCAAAEAASFFERRFDGIVAVGLIFLLEPHVQATLLQRVADALEPAGRFLFSAPREAVAWTDTMTRRPSVSLGTAGYRHALAALDLEIRATMEDEGGNHYFDVGRRA